MGSSPASARQQLQHSGQRPGHLLRAGVRMRLSLRRSGHTVRDGHHDDPQESHVGLPQRDVSEAVFFRVITKTR